MKKVLFMLIALAVFSSTAFAAELKIDSVSVTEKAVTVNYNTSDISENDYVTILTYKVESLTDDANKNNIKYIDQLIKGESSSVNFSLTDTPKGTYQIKMGGTDVENPDLISVTIDDKMEGALKFAKNSLEIFKGSLTQDEFFVTHENKPFILKPSDNFIAAYSTAPLLEGYTVKEYGIRLNSENYSAKVSLNSANKYAMLFKGEGITSEFTYTAMPYVIYEKAGEEPITVYGMSKINTIEAE